MRKALFEKLEQRLAMDSSWQNAFLPNDVDESLVVNPLDVLNVINDLNLNGARILPSIKPPQEPFCDVNGDGQLDPSDVLAVIDAINRTRDAIFIQSAPDSNLDLNLNGVVLGGTLNLTGKTLPGAFVDYVNPSNELRNRVLADQSGAFQIPLDLVSGVHNIEVTAMDDLGRKFPMVSTVRVGNVVQEWNAAALNVIRDWRGLTDDPKPGTKFTSEPPRVGRNMAMIHGAMFDAINCINPAYAPFVFDGIPTEQGLDPNIAAASAAFTVASQLYPTFMKVWDATLAESLNAYGSFPTKQSSIDFGIQVGNAIFAARANDGSDATVDYQPGNQPGDWNRTPPAFLAPLLPQWPDVIPFAM
ncbi:MAG: dockerin type I domain-containing protein, partial [Planctomycetota bacterium]